MIEFGYSLQANRQIDMDLNNLRMLKYIRNNEPSIDWCMSCGTCASDARQLPIVISACAV